MVLFLALLLAVLGLRFWPEAPPRSSEAWLDAAGLIPRFEIIAGTRVRYVRAGAGSPVLLIHGIASSLSTWREVFLPLAREHDVVALDLPGFGGSEIPKNLSAESYPGVVTGLMDRLQIPRAAVVGHSMGGAVALQLAASSGERVTRLALVDAAGLDLGPGGQPFLIRAAGWPAVEWTLAHLPLRRVLVRAGLEQVFYDERRVTEERVEEYFAPLARPGTAAALASLVRSADRLAPIVPALVPRIRAPTLVLWGREDGWIPVAHAQRFVDLIPGARSVILDHCGHIPQEERPEEVAPVLGQFFREDAIAKGE